jgi:hypothetical protein
MNKTHRRHSVWRTLKVILVILLIPCLLCALFLLYQALRTDPAMEQPAETPAASLTPTPVSTPDPMLELQEDIESMLAEQTGDWAVCIEDLSSHKQILINDHQMVSASLIKLFTAGRYFDAIENGEIQETDTGDAYLASMISQSDNDAWVSLETLIGQGNYDNGLVSVTNFANQRGYVNTGRLIGASSIYDAEAENMTSVSEVNDVLKSIYEGTYVNEQASDTILELMKQQDHRWKIPAGIPDDIIVANKTGELAEVENDCAIVFGPDTDFTITVMSSDPSDIDHKARYQTIAEIAQTAFDALEPSYTYTDASVSQADQETPTF